MTWPDGTVEGAPLEARLCRAQRSSYGLVSCSDHVRGTVDRSRCSLWVTLYLTSSRLSSSRSVQRVGSGVWPLIMVKTKNLNY